MIRAEWNSLREALADLKDLAGDPVEMSLRPASLEDAVRVADKILRLEEEEERGHGAQALLVELDAWRRLGDRILDSDLGDMGVRMKVRVRVQELRRHGR